MVQSPVFKTNSLAFKTNSPVFKSNSLVSKTNSTHNDSAGTVLQSPEFGSHAHNVYTDEPVIQNIVQTPNYEGGKSGENGVRVDTPSVVGRVAFNDSPISYNPAPEDRITTDCIESRDLSPVLGDDSTAQEYVQNNSIPNNSQEPGTEFCSMDTENLSAATFVPAKSSSSSTLPQVNPPSNNYVERIGSENSNNYIDNLSKQSSSTSCIRKSKRLSSSESQKFLSDLISEIGGTPIQSDMRGVNMIAEEISNPQSPIFSSLKNTSKSVISSVTPQLENLNSTYNFSKIDESPEKLVESSSKTNTMQRQSATQNLVANFKGNGESENFISRMILKSATEFAEIPAFNNKPGSRGGIYNAIPAANMLNETVTLNKDNMLLNETVTLNRYVIVVFSCVLRVVFLIFIL